MTIVINLTEKQMLTKALKHFAKQKHRAINPGSVQCRYRADNGDTCAIGCLIPKSQYTPRIEGSSVNLINFSFPKIKVERFVSDLQVLHDFSNNAQQLKTEARALNSRYGVMPADELNALLSAIKVWS